LAGLVLYLLLGLVGALAAVQHSRRAWPIVLFPALYFAAYAVANPLIFRWYLAPPLPVYFLLILAGLDRLATDVARAQARPWAPRAAVALWSLAVAGALFTSLLAWTPRPDHGPTSPAPVMAWHQLELHYTEIGRWLAQRVTPGTVVAAGDVGALGYYSGARILDTVGLMSPEATRYYPLDPALYVINYAVAPALITDLQPDYVVILEVYGRRGLLDDPEFVRQYQLARQIDTDIYGSRGLLVWERGTP
jgi:hypothetical protein